MLNKYRHGDLSLVGIKALPNGLKNSNKKIIMQGSGGNDHSIDNGDLYLITKGQFVIGYLVAENTTLYHIEHGIKIKGKKLREAKIKDGIYELRKQCEDTHDGMKQVID